MSTCKECEYWDRANASSAAINKLLYAPCTAPLPPWAEGLKNEYQSISTPWEDEGANCVLFKEQKCEE